MPAKRSWHDYNGSLVERGRVLIDVGFLKSTNIETEKMNEGKKVGAPFRYPVSYIQFLAIFEDWFRDSYRAAQWILQGLSDYIKIEEMHFTHVRRRMLLLLCSLVKEAAEKCNIDIHADKA